MAWPAVEANPRYRGLEMRIHPARTATLCAVFVAFGLISLRAGDTTAKDPFSKEDRQYWAFQRVQRSAPPAVRNKSLVRNPIDAFIQFDLESKGLSLGSPADKVTLIRRATLDLIGLPPAPEEVDAFLADKSARAFEKVVDRLLASPHYGERWARHWLDLARYAESEGFKSDETRPNAWRYRDYVIKAFNTDKPYDRFIREQIAGDELWPDDPDARVATAFNRHYPDESNARNLMQRRQEILNDLFAKYPPEIQIAIAKPASERTPTEWLMYYKAKPYMNPDSDEVAKSLKGDAKAKWQALKQQLDKFADLHPGDLPIGIGIADAGRQAPKTFTLAVGVYDRPLMEVEPGFLSIIDPRPARITPPKGLESTGRRTALANSLADPKNPLTPRVMVNRIWNYHFGQGIVASPSDLGRMGENPTHPRLLDWLASEF